MPTEGQLPAGLGLPRGRRCVGLLLDAHPVLDAHPASAALGSACLDPSRLCHPLDRRGAGAGA